MAITQGDKQSGARATITFGDEYTVTGATAAAGTITLTITATTHDIPVGASVFVADVGGFDDLTTQSYLVTAADATTIGISSTATGTFTSGGTVQQNIGIADFSLESSSESISVRDSDTARNANGFLYNDTVSGSVTQNLSFTAHKKAGVAFPFSETNTYEITLYQNLPFDGDTVTGTLRVNSVSIAASVDGAMTASVSGEFTGATVAATGTAY